METSETYWMAETTSTTYFTDGRLSSEEKQAIREQAKIDKKLSICSRRYKSKETCTAAIERAGFTGRLYPVECFDWVF